jgi:hypothetical protein
LAGNVPIPRKEQAMGTALQADGEDVPLCDDTLRVIQSQLEILAHETANYPIECSLGTYAFLFESRDDVEVLLESLSEELTEDRTGA